MKPTDASNQQDETTNGLLASLLEAALTKTGGTHTPSMREGFKKGYVAGQQSIQAAAPVKEERIITKHIAVKIEDARDDAEHRVSFDKLLLDDARFDIPAKTIKQFRADALRLLGEDHQPTDDQWKAILSRTTSAATIGIAGTGKTYVMMLRVIFLHCYLEIPLEDMTVLAVSKDCRMDIITELGHLLARWGVNLSQEQCLKLVKTPRSVMVSMLREVPPMREVVPFELLGEIEHGDEDGRAFDPRLNNEQLEAVGLAYQYAYTNNASFARRIQLVFADSIALPREPADNPVLLRYSEVGTAQLKDDQQIIAAVTSAWHAAGHWPIPQIEAKQQFIDVFGKSVAVNGYMQTLDAYVVLGHLKQQGRTHSRQGSDVPLYEECLGKRAFLQRFASQRVIWIDSPEQLNAIVAGVEELQAKAPSFIARVKGHDRPTGIAESLYQACSLIETLGLNPAKAISGLRFMPHDPDAAFFDCAAMFWPMFETYLLNRSPQVMTFNRLFMTFGAGGAKNLKAIPTSALRSMRNLLTDELQDITRHTGEFIKACMVENRHRMEIEGINSATLSVFACGDDFQTAHGTQGATPKYLTDFSKHFPAKGHVLNLLGTNFRSQQGIIYSAHALITGIPAISILAPASAANTEVSPVEVYELGGGLFMRLFDMHYGSGESILILAANPDDYRASWPYVGVVVERDKNDNPDKRQVRVRAAQRSKGMEADVVFIIGDFEAATSTWAKNQLFRSAQTVETEGQSPFDMIQQNELYRLAHISITRARKKCYWLLSNQDPDAVHKLRASTRINGVAGAFLDHR